MTELAGTCATCGKFFTFLRRHQVALGSSCVPSFLRPEQAIDVRPGLDLDLGPLPAPSACDTLGIGRGSFVAEMDGLSAIKDIERPPTLQLEIDQLLAESLSGGRLCCTYFQVRMAHT
jgi:hypothetical protein